jgi:hypothetical protein
MATDAGLVPRKRGLARRSHSVTDSEYNRQFHGEDLAIFRCPSHPNAVPGQTTYSVIVGPEMAFEGGTGKRFADFETDSADRVLVVERGEPVNWMNPVAEVTQADADEGFNLRSGVTPGRRPVRKGIASWHPGGANFAFRSGAVRFLAETTWQPTFQEMLRGKNTAR